MESILDLPLILQSCLVVLAIAMLLAFVRLLLGPSLPDRVVALDVMATLAIGILVLFAMAARKPLFLDVALAMALIVFLGTVAFARYMEKDKSHSSQ